MLHKLIYFPNHVFFIFSSSKKASKSQRVCNKMSEFYKVVKVDGKGLGCVATKDIKRGTLILREKAQLCYKGSEIHTRGGIKSVVESFKQMSKDNQEEFLKLHNHYLELDLSSDKTFTKYQHQLRSKVSQVCGNMAYEREKILEILGICSANNMKRGDFLGDFECVGIQASRFNQSCSPNIMVRVAAGTGEIFVRAIKKIKTGEEISFCNEINCIAKIREARQKYLKETANFICACNFCKHGKEDIEAFEAFEKLNEDHKRFNTRIKEILMNNLNQPPKNPTELISFLKEEISCMKAMYNLGNKKKVALFFLYYCVYLP